MMHFQCIIWYTFQDNLQSLLLSHALKMTLTTDQNICTHFRYKLTKTLHFQRKKWGGVHFVYLCRCASAKHFRRLRCHRTTTKTVIDVWRLKIGKSKILLFRLLFVFCYTTIACYRLLSHRVVV